MWPAGLALLLHTLCDGSSPEVLQSCPFHESQEHVDMPKDVVLLDLPVEIPQHEPPCRKMSVYQSEAVVSECG